MGLHQIPSTAQYVDFLREQPAESDRLLKDLLISVTSFFRDPPAFEELASCILELMKARQSEAPIRIWVPACATGEEAYSIAIVVAEQIAAAQSACRVQIFATDVDEDALEVARGGVYPASIALDVTPQRLTRFFTRADHHYTVVKSIRESVVFAVQNVLADPPFSKLDLVSCRNLLILEPSVQEKLMGVFHFSLNPGGYLFLGSAERTGSLEALFVPRSKPGRIFRRAGSGKHLPLHLPQPRPTSPGVPYPDQPAAAASDLPVASLANRELLAHFAPAAVVVRRSGQIVHLYGAMDHYIHFPTGEATLDLTALARDTLKPTLRAALHGAVRRSRSAVLETLDVTPDRKRATLRITARPLDVQGAAEPLWLVIFESRPSTLGRRAPDRRGKLPELVRRLEAELKATRKEHQHLIEQNESSNEELRAANEEVLSMNEELQSTNEELVLSKEELQSMNEELTTLNAQLQEKVQEVTATGDDLANLLVSTNIATVFVDLQLRIKRFTTAAGELLNLLPSDVGRPIPHIASNLVRADLSGEANAVLASLTITEKEVDTHDGRHYLLRALPYRSDGQVVQGVVLTLSDVTRLEEDRAGTHGGEGPGLSRFESNVEAARRQHVAGWHRRLIAVAGRHRSCRHGDHERGHVRRSAVRRCWPSDRRRRRRFPRGVPRYRRR